jgi:molybdenum cofactor guanylyltransferase
MSLGEDSIAEYAAPVLAVCGYSGSGKTTLLEAAIPQLVERGLAVAVVKHDAHRFEVDRAGKDSDRLFRAGATVVLRGSDEQFERRAEPLTLEVTLARLACDHDLLLVEGHKDTALPKFWLSDAGQSQPPVGVAGIASVLPWDSELSNTARLFAFLDYIDRWLPTAWRARPLARGLLLGGMSSRMGRPKQSVRFGGRALGEIAFTALSEQADAKGTAADCTNPSAGRVVLLGSGVLPSIAQPNATDACPQLRDAPEFAGPGAGMIAAHRWAPQAAWIVAACDHPWLHAEHIEWLAAQRQPGRWAVVPRQRDGHPCPTLALYEPQALEAMERLARANPTRGAEPLAMLSLPRTAIVHPPAELADGWINVNTPEQLRAEEERLAASQH